MKTLAIVQARMGSTRLPGKVMRTIVGKPMIELLLHRLSLAQQIDRIVLATSDHTQDRPLAEHVRELGYAVYRGSEKDVLDRYYRAARSYKPAAVVRITGDCPLIDPDVVDAVVAAFHASQVDYLSNTIQRTFPNGLDTEVFSFPALEQASREATRPDEREHVTPYLRESGRFAVGDHLHEEDCSAERWTVDEPEDLEVVTGVFTHFHPRLDFGWLEILALRRQQPRLFAANRHIPANEGATMSTGQKLWRRAKRVIPGGSMLLSKRPEMFLPERWPAYFSRARGCRVWDLDEREYIDMAIMGIGTNILGYGHPHVDEAVMQAVRAGNMSTLNCPDEVALAERLVELHPWAEMVRFARSGGEANAIAIRIARATTGRDKVAICGYHGWHDWYLSANLADDHNLDGHLLPGLAPKGVPHDLAGTVFPFTYNRFDELEALVAQHDIGIIEMEVSRHLEPQAGFLQNVRKLATDRNIVLIFDECTSGFRETFGGLHKKFGVEPDMAMFGKALGNGYAITAVIGRRAVMEAAQSTFISSTFWTERIGPSAALATLEVMERERSWERITTTGRAIAARWQRLAAAKGVRIELSGLPALIGFTVHSPQALEYKTLITQEMQAKGYLAATSVYVCTEHTPQVVDGYFEALDSVFDLIGECEQGGRDVRSLLQGPVCHAGFRRLN